MKNRFLDEIAEIFRILWKEQFRGKEGYTCKISVKFYPYTTLKNTIRIRGDVIFIRISDMLMDAPQDVIRALGIIMFCKLDRKKPPEQDVKLYKDHLNSNKMQELIKNVRKERGKKVLAGSKGQFYDLDESFERINTNYFNGKLKKPNLSWNKRRTRSRFGHHDDALNTIIISRTLDDKDIPLYLLDYVMYHEMLHIKHGIIYENGRRMVHTSAFKKDEKNFTHWERAEALLKKISGGSYRRH